jgi:hypothetical protein
MRKSDPVIAGHSNSVEALADAVIAKQAPTSTLHVSLVGSAS